MLFHTKSGPALMVLAGLTGGACGGGARPAEEAPGRPVADALTVGDDIEVTEGGEEASDTGEAAPEDQGGGSRGDFVKIAGGAFAMGSADGDADEQPVHEVTVPSFEMLRTEVTVAEYEECVFLEKCHWPPDRKDAEACNIGHRERKDHPVNCIDWHQARHYCEWLGGRLPTEAEWEFAARSRGKAQRYPWGDEPASCEVATMASEAGNGCGREMTGPVCAKPAGNTAEGLCDMAGNVVEWVEDRYHDHYNGAPKDGSAWPAVAEKHRVIRGGSWMNDDPRRLRATERVRFNPDFGDIHNGFRCVR